MILLIIWLINIFRTVNLERNIWGIVAILILGLSLLFVLRSMFFRSTFSIDKDVLEITEIIGYTKRKKKIQCSEIIQLAYKIEGESLRYRPHTVITTSTKVYKIGLEMTEEASFYCYCWVKAIVNL